MVREEKEADGKGESYGFNHLLGDCTHTTRMVCVPRHLMQEHCSATGTVPFPEQMFLLDMLHQPFFVKRRGIRATLPLA